MRLAQKLTLQDHHYPQCLKIVANVGRNLRPERNKHSKSYERVINALHRPHQFAGENGFARED